MQTTVLKDQRKLDVLLGGAASDTALVIHHGTPSDAGLWSDWDEIARERGLRLIACSRPGYGGSTRRAHRSVLDAVDDLESVLDAHDIRAFVVAGWSGGGPHAIACAARFPDRARAVATLAGIAPWGAAGLDWLANMGPENHEEFGAALTGEASLRDWLEVHAASMRTDLPRTDRRRPPRARADTLGSADRYARRGERGSPSSRDA